MRYDMNMTISELVEQMNNGGNQNELYKLSKIKKDVIPYIFKVAGYERKKQKYVPLADATPDITIEKLIPLAKEMEKQTKLDRPKNNGERIKRGNVLDKGIDIGTNVSEYSFNFANKADMQRAILGVLDLNTSDLEAIRALKGATHTNTIYEAISKLQSRQRSNKTYYISIEIAQNVQLFCESKGIKVSQFVEVSLLEAMKKYDK